MHDLIRSFGAFAGLLALGSIAPGCSISNISGSISTSISSPFEWSSSSLGGDDSAYQQEIRDYTVAHARSGDDLVAFRRDIGSLAGERGITDWESDRATVAAIGEGLDAAGFDSAEARRFASRLFPDDEARIEVALLGYAGTP
jgi:hypothetical protein